MWIGTKNKKRAIAFTEIREGTILKMGQNIYMKGNNGAAVDMKTGQIIYPANDTDPGWEECFIYPGASLNLH